MHLNQLIMVLIYSNNNVIMGGLNKNVIIIVGSLSAKKWVKCYFPDKSTKLAGMVGKGLRSNIFNGSKMTFHYFVFYALFSKWRLFA